MAGGYCANYINMDEGHTKWLKGLDEKPNGRVVLLIDNDLLHSGKKMICGTEVHYGPIRSMRDLVKYKGLPITDYNVAGYLAPDLEREVQQLVRPRRKVNSGNKS